MSVAGGFSITHGAHVGIGTLPIVLFGNEEQRKSIYRTPLLGDKISAYALTEPVQVGCIRRENNCKIEC